MRLESVCVGGAEGDGELVGGVHGVVAEGLGGEVEAAGQPEKTLGGSVFLCGELGDSEGLEGCGVRGGGELAVANFLWRGRVRLV